MNHNSKAVCLVVGVLVSPLTKQCNTWSSNISSMKQSLPLGFPSHLPLHFSHAVTLPLAPDLFNYPITSLPLAGPIPVCLPCFKFIGRLFTPPFRSKSALPPPPRHHPLALLSSTTTYFWIRGLCASDGPTRSAPGASRQSFAHSPSVK